jgi:hypothetical protein
MARNVIALHITCRYHTDTHEQGFCELLRLVEQTLRLYNSTDNLHLDRMCYSYISSVFRNIEAIYPCNRQWRPVGLWNGETPTFSRHSDHRWRWGCQPYAPADSPLPPGRFLVLISVRGSIDPWAIVRLEGLGQLKNPIISSGIEPATFRWQIYV